MSVHGRTNHIAARWNSCLRGQWQREGPLRSTDTSQWTKKGQRHLQIEHHHLVLAGSATCEDTNQLEPRKGAKVVSDRNSKHHARDHDEQFEAPIAPAVPVCRQRL